MKILQFGKFFPPDVGGIENFMHDLTEELSQKIRCDVLCSNSRNKTVIERKENYTVTRTASFGELFSTSISPAMIYWLGKIGNDYDIIHLHLPDPMATFAYFLIRPKTKLILHWHSDVLKQKRLLKIYIPLQDWILKRANRIICTSTNYLNASEYLKNYKDKSVVIPLGLNPKKLQIKESKVKEIKERFKNKPILFTLGRLTYYKGFEYLIEAIKELNCYLLIGGSGPLKYKLENLIKKLKIESKVFLLGRIKDEDLGSYYQACDIFCLPSIYKTEAFGLVQAEAMYFGKPIVSTRIKGSGVDWVNKDNITGLTVEPKNINSLHKAIKIILHNTELKNKFGENAKKRFKENFDIKIVASNILNLYKEVLGKDNNKI